MRKLYLFIILIFYFFFIRWKNPMENLFTPQREVQNINAERKYLERNVSQITGLREQKGWESLDIPHTWNQWSAADFSPGYRGSGSWYRKMLHIPVFDKKKYLLYLGEGNIATEVYVNGQLAGQHVGGYAQFEIDITPFVRRGKANEIAVRLDNGFNQGIH